MKNTKRTYYKVVCKEFPEGIYQESKSEAIESANECRAMGDKNVYIRAVKLTPSEYESMPEI